MVADLGVYGCWLLKHGKHLPENPGKHKIIRAYKMYHDRPETGAIGILMGVIDEYCHEYGFEKPRGSYPEALAEIQEARRG